MDRILDSINAWWNRHPHEAEMVLWIASILLSLFTGVLRRTFFLPIRYTSVGFLRVNQKRAARELQIMKLMGDSPFMLISYLGFYLIHSLLWTFGTSLVIFLVADLGRSPLRGSNGIVFFGLLFLSGMTGRVINLYGLLGDFLDRDKAAMKLEKIVAGDRSSK